ncbi:hypothetical protein YERSI8AC_510009 [Enterobacterales bacterium 8AC]|nr:hypothetical protein YERSI8AC_510009 [Enterobacterales bacterium 8AC]
MIWVCNIQTIYSQNQHYFLSLNYRINPKYRVLKQYKYTFFTDFWFLFFCF